jgi:hypothetical protein
LVESVEVLVDEVDEAFELRKAFAEILSFAFELE